MAVEAPGTNPAVTGAIRHASKVTGTNFQYLIATAQVESRLNPTAAAPTSSARGLFQFIEQTWLATLKEHGSELGYSQLSNAIERAPNGHYVVSDPRLNSRIMNLRNDPTINAVMAGAYTRANAGHLADRLGRSPTEGELYIAHFLGSNGAGRLISLADAKPGMRADEAFPTAARANRSIFYDAKGRARSVADVYRSLIGRYAAARGNPPASPPEQQVAAVPVTKPSPAAVQAAVAPNAAFAPAPNAAFAPASNAAFAPDGLALMQAFAAAEQLATAPPPVAAAESVFHGLFRTGEGREAVAPVVSALWTAPTAVSDAGTAPLPQQSATPPAPGGTGTMSLFQDQAADARALFRGGA
jgi:Transglycosylase SLT domain